MKIDLENRDWNWVLAALDFFEQEALTDAVRDNMRRVYHLIHKQRREYGK